MNRITLKILLLTTIMAVTVFTAKDCTYGAGKIVGHKDVVKIQSYLTKNPSIAEKISKSSWLFTHASVGANMSEGMRSLKAYKSSIYRLDVTRVGENPTESKAGKIYEMDRGNPGFMPKITMFEGYIKDKGWGNKIDIAMNKHCYIDTYYDNSLSASANKAINVKKANDYTRSMSSLEKAFPNITFVYTTMPITISSEGRDNLARQYYNNKVRSYCKNNGKYLLDIADVESTSASGKMSRVTVKGIKVQVLNRGYTYDNGHLNQKGQERVGKAWYAMAAAIAKVK